MFNKEVNKCMSPVYFFLSFLSFLALKFKLNLHNFFFYFRSEAAEKNLMLRTKAMREKDELREMKKYRFAIIRVRFPDGILLQVLNKKHFVSNFLSNLFKIISGNFWRLRKILICSRLYQRKFKRRRYGIRSVNPYGTAFKRSNRIYVIGFAIGPCHHFKFYMLESSGNVS